MAFLRSLWFRIRSRFRRDALDAELAEELEVHRAFLEDEVRRRGVDPSEVTRQAAIRLGNRTTIRESTRDGWSWGWVEILLQDARYAFRFLRRSPGFTAVAVGSLALGIGANAAVFTVVDRLLLRPPAHVRDPGAWHLLNVRRVYDAREGSPYHPIVMFPEYFALQAQASSFAEMVIYTPPSLRRFGRGPDAPRIKDSMVSGNFFTALGIHPVLGRFFDADDLRPDAAERSAVISYALWERHFGRTADAIGARLQLTGVEFTVIGVAPEGFTGIELDAADTWTPLDVAAPLRIGPAWKEWTGFVPRVAVRLREGVQPVSANAEATVIMRRVPTGANSGDAEETVQLGPVLSARGPAEQSAEVKVSTRLALASGLVLLAACANLANLLLVRALGRRREIALRLAVGIPRRRLVGQLGLEALIISIMGAGAALLAARWGGAALRTMVFPQLQWPGGTLDLRVVMFALACAVTSALLATLAPAMRMTRADVSSALRSASPQLALTTGRLRRGLLILQVGLAVLLIVGATVFGQSLRRAYEFDMGVDVGRVVLARLSLEEDTLAAEGRRRLLADAARRVRSVVGVERVSESPLVPLSGGTYLRAHLPTGDSTFVVVYSTTPDLIPVLGYRLLRGRWILPEDVRGGGAVALVSETMARRLWPGRDPIGECARFGSDPSLACRPIIGVIADVRLRSIREEAPAVALLSNAESSFPAEIRSPAAGPGRVSSSYLVIRSTRQGIDLVPGVRAALRDIRPDLASIDVRPLALALDYEYRPLRLGTIMFGAFAVLTVILAGVGLFGILAFSVAQRTSELGIRSALGAQRGDLVRHVMGEGLAIVGIGLVVGAGASWYARTAVETLLFNTTTRSAMPFTVSALVLGIVAVLASALPAWHASRVDPATALRAE